MIRRRLTIVAATAAPLLLLTACSGGTPDNKPEPPPHPVFSKPLGAQPYAALQQTQKAGSASFTQKVTFTSKQGDAVLTITGRLDFAGKRGEGSRTWLVPKAFPDKTKEVMLGAVGRQGFGDSSAKVAIDPQAVRYRSGSATYWLRYPTVGSLIGFDSITSLRGSEAALGGTLLEVPILARATAQQNTPGGGRSYRTEFGLDAAWGLLFPLDVRGELARPRGADAAKAPVVMTLTVDSQGRITRAAADLSALVNKDKERALSTVTGIRSELTLTAHGSARPAMPPPSDAVLDAAKSVLDSTKTSPGDCIDFNTGTHRIGRLVRVGCTAPHDGRIFGHSRLGDGGFPGRAAAERRAEDGCRRAHDRAPSRWTDEAVVSGEYRWIWPLEASDEDPVATCYVVSRR
ncbi:hypothetical protein ACFYRC_34835 [Streptomyces sp. NPDC005279]|uniref:hypothetical protein n=1 Tax=Streptomyces sp. NPDC005279 TaxID=3364712 RepID=UPI00368FAC0C